jgi:hypothetical protein
MTRRIITSGKLDRRSFGENLRKITLRVKINLGEIEFKVLDLEMLPQEQFCRLGSSRILTHSAKDDRFISHHEVISYFETAGSHLRLSAINFESYYGFC